MFYEEVIELDNATLTEEVKKSLGITSDDELVNINLRNKVVAVKEYLINGGALHMKEDPITKVNSITDIDISCIAIGVNDLLNNKAGETKFSPVFELISMQICRG